MVQQLIAQELIDHKNTADATKNIDIKNIKSMKLPCRIQPTAYSIYHTLVLDLSLSLELLSLGQGLPLGHDFALSLEFLSFRESKKTKQKK
jgi:hypothetical protein